MMIIVRFLAILFGGLADGLASFDRVMRDYNEFCKGMRTMNLRQRVKELEADNAAHELAIASLRTSLEQLECEHKVTEFKPTGYLDNAGHHACKQVCVDCGKVLRGVVTKKERIETEMKANLVMAAKLQDKLEALDGDE